MPIGWDYSCIGVVLGASYFFSSRISPFCSSCRFGFLFVFGICSWGDGIRGLQPIEMGNPLLFISFLCFLPLLSFWSFLRMPFLAPGRVSAALPAVAHVLGRVLGH